MHALHAPEPGAPSAHPCRWTTRRRWLAGSAAWVAAAAAPAVVFGAPPAVDAAPPGGSRIALVIGNGTYKSATLKNPVRDAEAVAASLQQLGYEVVLLRNADLRSMIEALREFSLRASRSAVRLLFYAGHGIQARGRNYLLPVDTEPQGEDELRTKAADVGEFIDRLAAIKHGLNLVVLDACRVNPFAGGVIAGPDGRRLKFRGMTRAGLAPLDAPVGTLIAFSTSPNGVALDGPAGENSVYAKHLLANLNTPGLPVEQMFKRVRIAVAAETARVQVPWESSSLTTDFCFKPDPNGQCG